MNEESHGLDVRAPWNHTWHTILRDPYTTEEADIVARSLIALSTLERISVG